MRNLQPDSLLRFFVNNFYEKYNKEPSANKTDFYEFQLYASLKNIREDNKKIKVEILKDQSGKVILRIVDQGQGFKEKKLNKIFDRFYSNRPDKFGEHSGLGLNIVKNLVELHSGIIDASNNTDQGGARIEIVFPKV